MSWRDDIKNRIKLIRENQIIISDLFPHKDNFAKKNYRKCWITCLFVDIAGYTSMCEESKDNKKIGLIIRTFQEGVLDIMNEYDLRHIQIQGDGIFGVLPNASQNDKNAEKILNCAMDINGYLMNFWKEAYYRISIAQQEELMIIVGKDDNQNEAREVVFAGGAVNKAKNQMIENKKNCILIDSIFENNNKELLVGKISGTVDNSTKYSTYHYEGWE